MAAVQQIATARRLLRRWRPHDAAAMAAINADPQVTRYLNRPVDAAATAAFHARVVEHWEEHGFGFWAVELCGPEAPGSAPFAAERVVRASAPLPVSAVDAPSTSAAAGRDARRAR